MAIGNSAQVSVCIQHEDFDIESLQRNLLGADASEGAIATFTGYVRGDVGSGEFSGMDLEHYPGMTENSIETIVAQAAVRWPILAASVVHRVGRLLPGDKIVWVGVASAHRAAAFSACEFIMDYLKTQAPLWKKEFDTQEGRWAEAKASDFERARRWERK